MSTTKACLGRAIDAILQAKELAVADREKIAGSLQRFLDRPDLPDEQALQKLAFLLRDARRDIYIAQVTKQATERKSQALLEKFSQFQGLDAARAVRDYTTPSAGTQARAVSSVESKIRATVEESAGRLWPLWNRIFSAAGNDTAFLLDFRKALLGLESSAEARQVAKLYREVTNGLLERLRKTGVYVGHIDNYMPRNWSYSKIRSNMDEFTRLMRENLDPREHPDADATIDRMLYHIEHADLDDPTQAVISMAREIKFKTPEGELEVMLRFNEDNLAAQLMHGVRMLAKRTVLAEEYGPSPRAAMQPALEYAAREARGAFIAANRAGNKAAQRRARSAERDARIAAQMVDVHTGHLAAPHNQSLANYSGAARDWMSAMYLGRVGLAQMTMDSFNSVMRSRFHTGGFASGLTGMMTNLVEIMGNKAAREYAQELGLWAHAFQMASAGRFQSAFAQGRQIRGVAAKAAVATQRLSTAMWSENALRSSMGLVVSRQLARNLQHSWSDLHPRYRTLLENSGINGELWRSMRSAQINELGAVDFGSMNPRAREAAMSFLYREVDTGVVHPDSYDRWLLTAGQAPGTVSGEAIAASTQFFSWPVAFFRKMVISEWQMGKSGFVGFAAGTMALSALTTQLYALSAGEPAFEWDSLELWVRAATRSSLMTPAGEMVLNALGGRGVDAGGPLGGSAIQLLRSVGIAAQRALDGELDRAAAPLIRQARNLAIPNYWWSDAAVVSRAMDMIMWELDPQYMRDRERRWRQEGRAF